jgi:GT2 family glycosyltransferase/tetratricopeptide (TPR) repeat protein
VRLRASVIIPAWNEWALTRACLESLRPTLGVRDEVIVVDNGSTDDTAAGLRRYSWVKVVRHPQNLGFAAGCNSGAAVATGDVVVFLNNDTLVSSRWLDGLLRPFADATVGATGPRSNFVSGPQLVPSVAYSLDRASELSSFARSWRQEHQGRTTEVTRLVGFCLAVRRESFDALGGFDETFGLGGAEDDDLCLRLADAGHRLLIAHEAFVHHHGHRTFEGNGVDWYALQEQNLERLRSKRRGPSSGPLVSACMIVKDEQDDLPACLEAAQRLADEVVVYDTGSTDATVEIARAAGAVVVEGYWDDDFARARNAALAHCTGTWILHVDADELVQGDMAAVKRELRQTEAETLAVTIHNLGDTGEVELSHRATRLLRRGRAHWQGGLHEQVVTLDGRPLRQALSSLTLLHSGYTSAVMTAKDKRARNLRVARAAADTGDEGLGAVNLGRALRSAGQDEQALEQFERAVLLGGRSAILRQARRFGAEALMSLGRSREALDWVEALRTHTDSKTMPDYLAGTALLNLLDAEGALRHLEPLETVADEDLTIPERMVQERRGLAFLAAQRWADAASELRRAIGTADAGEGPWAELVESQSRSGAPLAELMPLLPEDGHLVRVLGRVANASTSAADGFAEALWSTDRPHSAVLALVGQLGDRLDLARALEWSARLRAHGAASHCTVARLTDDVRRPALERLRGCAVLTVAFSDDRGALALPSVAAALRLDEFVSALEVLDQLAPALLPAFVRAAVSTPSRTASMAAALEQMGAEDVARELLAQPA